MAKLMSKKTREIVKTVVVLVVVAALVTFYLIYPLFKVPDMTARPDRDKFEDSDFAPANDPAFFTDLGLAPDTFAVVSQDNIRLAGLLFGPDSAVFEAARGTVFLLHPDDTDRTALAACVSPLGELGLQVVLYDQRASGLSGGRYHFAGTYEADDLSDIIYELKIHDRLPVPVVAVGFELGGDAVLIADNNDIGLDAVVAVNPHLTGTRWIRSRIEHSGAIRIPLATFMYYWWFQKISGYPFERTGIDDLRPISSSTMVLGDLDEESIMRLKEISPADKLTVVALPDEADSVCTLVIDRVRGLIEQAETQVE